MIFVYCSCLFCCFFFFSSRRRHTRCGRDWSSDVCSSDLGTSQVRDVLGTQTLAMDKLKVRRIEVNGKLRPGVYAKDVALYIIQKLGVKGGVGFAYEYAGDVFDAMSMDERMTVCNMSIERSEE